MIMHVIYLVNRRLHKISDHHIENTSIRLDLSQIYKKYSVYTSDTFSHGLYIFVMER